MIVLMGAVPYTGRLSGFKRMSLPVPGSCFLMQGHGGDSDPPSPTPRIEHQLKEQVGLE